MKRITLGMLFLLFSTTVFSQQIERKWTTEDGEAVIEIFKTEEKLNGRIVWLKNGQENGKPLTDKKNPDISKRDQPLLGLLMLKNLQYKNHRWENGHIYDPETGKSYKCSVWIEKGRLKVRGYIGMFYDTQTWS